LIRVVAVTTAKPGNRDACLAGFRANVPNVRAEKGCIEYAAHVDADGVGPLQAKFGPDAFRRSRIVGEPRGAPLARSASNITIPAVRADASAQAKCDLNVLVSNDISTI
jgi:hypothetical protein